MLKPAVSLVSLILTVGFCYSPQASLATEPTVPTNNSSDVATQPTRLEISLSRRQVTLYQENTTIKTYPVAVGRSGWETPTGNFQVLQKLQNPKWINPFRKDLKRRENWSNGLTNQQGHYKSRSHQRVAHHRSHHTAPRSPLRLLRSPI